MLPAIQAMTMTVWIDEERPAPEERRHAVGDPCPERRLLPEASVDGMTQIVPAQLAHGSSHGHDEASAP